MRITTSLSLLVLSTGYASAFIPAITRRNNFATLHDQSSKTKLNNSYLDGLSSFNSNNQVPAAPNGDIYTTPSEASPEESFSGGFSYAPFEYFHISNMQTKGPRATADWGTPQDATRKLDDDGSFRVGAWYCSEGGWPSPNHKAHTEIFYVDEGHGCLTDTDGFKHYFGPGDTVIIPKGHQGRWDVYSPIHKIWAVNAHEQIEEDMSKPIRVVVEHYHKFSPQYMVSSSADEPLYGLGDQGSTRTFYDVGPTKVGAYTCDSGSSFPFSTQNNRVFFHVLEGVMFLTDCNDGSSRKCIPGDTVQINAGFEGYIDVIEPMKKLWTVAA